MANWPEKFIKKAHDYALDSEDNSTKVGCVVFSDDGDQLSAGWNGLCRGIEPTEANFARPTKYLYFEHAERNAFYNAARTGVSLKGANIAITHFPCADCARGIIQTGIKKVYYGQYIDSEQWQASNNAAVSMLMESGVEFVRI